MGTPVPSKTREAQCERIDSTVTVRQLTAEERQYYDSLAKPKTKAVYIFPEDEDLYISKKEDDKEMPKKIEVPSREELATMCMKYPGKYRAACAIAQTYGISRATADRWILDYGLKGIWDKPVMAIQERPIQVKDEEPVKYEYLKDPNDPKELTLGVQPGNGQIIHPEEEVVIIPEKSLVAKLRHAQYKIGSATVGIDFEHEKIRVSPDGLSFEEAAALVELLNDIL